MELLNGFINYLNSQKKKPSVNTVKNYKADVNRFIRFVEEEFKTDFSPIFVTPQILEIYKKAKTTYTSEESWLHPPTGGFSLPPSEVTERISRRSLERHLSSLRKFFGFLKNENLISVNPFEEQLNELNARRYALDADIWHLQDFKRHLSNNNKSRLTIKNYILDIKNYIKWATEVTDKNTIIFDANCIEEYKNRLLEKGAAPRSINRKLSSLRQYLSWATEKGLTTKKSAFADSGGSTFVESSLDSRPVKNITQNNVSSQKEFHSKFLFKVTPFRRSNLSQVDASCSAASEVSYSRIPPLRLLQKTLRLGNYIFDKTVIHFLSESFDYADYWVWRLKGKPLLCKKKAQKVNVIANGVKQSLSFLGIASSSPEVSPRNDDNKELRNIPKSFYAPLEISIEGFPVHKKIFHLLRHARPQWYKRYHAYVFSHYLHAAILVVCMSIAGSYIYNSLNQTASKRERVLASFASPQIVSFQGRLYKQGIPVTASRLVRFALYNSPTASGSALLWQEIDSVQPDKDGNFSVLLGNFATGGTPVAQTILADNPSLWVGVTIENENETTPRQPLPTVGLASDSQSLQGLSPITRSHAGTTNVVLALDSSGNLTMTGGGDHTFQTLGGEFKISGKGVSLSTLPGSSTDIQIAPDGLGKIDLQKPLTNTLGSIEFEDAVNILATSSAESVLTINQDSTGPLITASVSGIPKFTINNDGGGFFAGNVGIGTQSAQSPLAIEKITSGSVLSLFTKVASESGGQAYETFGDSETIERWKVGLNAAIPSSIRTGYDIVEAQSGKSFLTVLKTGFVGIGTSSPADARLVVTNDGLTSGTAIKATSTLQDYASGDFSNTKSNTQVALAGQYAGIFTGGNVGIGTTTPKGYLDITSALSDAPAATISANTSSPALVVDNRGAGDLFTASSSGMARFAISQNGDVTVYGSSGSACAIGNGTSGTSCSSDIRLKDNISPLSTSLNKILSLRPVTFNWKASPNETKTGFVAQEVQQVFPEFVNQLPNGYLGIDYAALIVPTINALQELASQGEALQNQVATAFDAVASLSLRESETSVAISGIVLSQAKPDPRNDDNSVASQGEALRGQEFEDQVSRLRARNYVIKTNTDRIIDSIGGFAKLVIGTVKAGLVETQDAIVEGTLASTKIISPLAEIDQIHTNIISPLSSDSVVIHLKSVQSSKFKVQSSEGKDVATIDSGGNVYAEGSISARSATFSGQLSSTSLRTENATIAGTLRVKKIIAEDLSTSEESWLRKLSLPPSEVSSDSAIFNNFNAGFGIFTQSLISLGPTSLNDTAIAGQLSVGAPLGGLILADNSINILGGADLHLQPLRQGGVSFGGGNIYIDTDGNLKVSGNAHFAKDVSVEGVLTANILSPLPDQDLVIRLPSSVIAIPSGVEGEAISGIATGSSNPRNDDKGKLLIKNASGSSVLAINNQGNLVASGSGTFTDLLSRGLTIVRSAQADTSLTETIATASAGTATIVQGETERTIITPFVKEESLIYITPTSDTQGITPYIARQTPSSFTIQIPQRIYKDIKVNWWIVN